jgi:hypothetical protein
MRMGLTICLSLALLVACNGAKNTIIPREMEKLDSIKPAMEKLTPEERELAAGYIMRHTMAASLGGIFGQKAGPGIPEGMTLGKAIEEQRKFKAELAIEEAKQQQLKAKLQAEREAAMKVMRETTTVTLISKKISAERGYSGITLDENINVTFGYKNNTEKEITGIKGRIVIKDLFGDDLSTFNISNDTTIKAGQSVTWTGSRSVKYSFGNNKDRKLAELSDDKFKVIWEPMMIVFKDGTKLTAPEE